MTRDDLARFRQLNIDFGAISLEWHGNDLFYFCTPADAEFVGWTGCDGVHFILLPGDERVFCVDPAMGEPGTYVLPVAEDFRQFLSFVLFCRDACPLAELRWLDEDRFRQSLREDAETSRPGREPFFEKRSAALERIAAVFSAAPSDPYARVKALQAAFDPSVLRFSDEYYDVLGIERESKGGNSMSDVLNYDSDCLFCRIIKGEIPSKKVYEDDFCYAFYDIDPQAPTHFLVIPKAHIRSCGEITKDNSALVGHMFEAISKITKELGVTDFRVVSNCGAQAGQSVPHLHFHVLAGRDMTWPPG